eukprot:4491059-Amphidinium_carterae.2
MLRRGGHGNAVKVGTVLVKQLGTRWCCAAVRARSRVMSTRGRIWYLHDPAKQARRGTPFVLIR